MVTNFTYFIPTRILFGAGQLNHLHEQQLPGKKALIVTTSGKWDIRTSRKTVGDGKRGIHTFRPSSPQPYPC